MTGVSDLPVVTGMQVIPVAGHDSMLLNLSGAHGPYFTRNIVILQDAAGRTGVGEVPGGERIRETLVESVPMVVSQSIGGARSSRAVRDRFHGLDAGGRGLQTFDRAWHDPRRHRDREAALLTWWARPWASRCGGAADPPPAAESVETLGYLFTSATARRPALPYQPSPPDGDDWLCLAARR